MNRNQRRQQNRKTSKFVQKKIDANQIEIKNAYSDAKDLGIGFLTINPSMEMKRVSPEDIYKVAKETIETEK